MTHLNILSLLNTLNPELLKFTSHGTPIIGKWNSFPLEVSISESFDNLVPAKIEILPDGSEVIHNAFEWELIEEMSGLWDEARGDGVKMINFSDLVPNKDKANIDDYLDDGEMGVYIKSNDWFPTISESSLAVTHYQGVLDETGLRMLDHSDIILNDFNFDFTLNPNGEAGKFDLATVLLHEFGHFLGLDHMAGETIMNTNLLPGSGDQIRKLEFKDEQALRDLTL